MRAQANCTDFKPFQLQVTSICPSCSPNEIKMSQEVYAGNLLAIAQQPVFIEYRIVSPPPPPPALPSAPRARALRTMSLILIMEAAIMCT